MAVRDTQAPRIADATRSVPQMIMTEAEAKVFVRKVTKSAWWRRRRRCGEGTDAVLVLDTTQGERYDFVPNTPGGRPSPGCGCVATIGLSGHPLTKHEILHRVAHFTCERPSDQATHGPAFAKEYAEAVRKFIGPDAKRELVAAFKTHKVKYIVHSAESRKAARHRKARADIIALAKELAS